MALQNLPKQLKQHPKILHSLLGQKNIVNNVIWEIGYDKSLAETVLERNVTDFSTVNFTWNIIADIVGHYGGLILSGDFEEGLGQAR